MQGDALTTPVKKVVARVAESPATPESHMAAAKKGSRGAASSKETPAPFVGASSGASCVGGVGGH